MQDPGEDSNTGSPLVGRFRLPLAHDTVREIIRKVSPIAVTATLILLALFSLFVGPVRISWSSAWYIFIAQFNQILNSALTGIHHVISQVPAGVSLFSNTGSRYYTMPEYDIIVQIQEPIVLAAVIVGAALAVGGSTVQGIFRNPITEPYIIGISSGAALGATLTIAVPQFSSDFGAFSLQVNAFFFSLLVVYITYFTSYRRGSVPVTYLLLTGVAISIFVSSIVAFIIYTNTRLQSEVFFWLMGSLQQAGWADIYLVGGIVGVCVILTYMFSGELDALQMGEDYASSLGVRVEFTKMALLTLVALSVSACVSIAGLIGFVGLIIPHISRMLFGGTSRKSIPWSVALGAIFLLLANDIAVGLYAERVVPVGIITGMIGVPFFLFIMYRLSGGAYHA